MITITVTAFFMGLLGSFHCVGMCGPLALSVPLKHDNTFEKLLGSLLYNIGRVITYSFLGLIIGLFGTSIAMSGLQQWLSIISGSLVLIYFIFGERIQESGSSIFPVLYEWIRTVLGSLFFKRTRSSVFLIGLLNGLLPCGFVYLAFAGALSAGSILNSVLFMVAFGLGTLPMMWSFVFFGQFFSASLSKGIKRLYPYMMMLMAFLLIIRGMGLGISYVSPGFETKNSEIHSCCHKK